jgi:membrane protease YdiL (CAAX protease family)
MTNYKQEIQSPLSGSFQLAGIVFRIFGIYFLGLGLVALIFKFIIGVDLQEIGPIIEQDIPDLEKQHYLLLVQSLAPLIQFILLPVVYIFFYQKILINDVFTFKTSKPATFFILSLMLYFTFLPVLEYLIKWNQSWHLPAAFAEVERSMIAMENQAKELTELLIKYDSNWEFLKVLIVVAVLPAIGEELFFRGLLQNELKYFFKNTHVAVWVSAFVFSFIHFQFFGFIPRMALGLMFGYAYVWSGNILVPIGLHFLNNAATLILMNTFREKYEQMESGPVESVSMLSVAFFTVLSGVLVYYIIQLYHQRKNIHAE